MNPTDIAWHLQNLGDTWSGWGDVLQSIAKLFSAEWRQALDDLIDLFKNGIFNPENKDQLREALKTPVQPNEEGKYEFDGLSSIKGSSKK